MFGYGSDPRIRTQLEMSQAMMARDPAVVWADTTVFIQCVGSRRQNAVVQQSMLQSHHHGSARVKGQEPASRCVRMYRDMTTFGLNEPYYEKARRSGVVFIRYEQENPPVVEVGEKITIRV